jgi:uncharacterized protein (DUF58 family)
MTYGSRSFADASGVGSDKSPDGRILWSKFDHATALSAALAYITLRQGDRVGVGVFANDLRALVKRSSSQGTWRQIVSALAMQPLARQTGPSTAFPRIVEQVLSKLHNRCIVAVVSDFFMDIQQLRDALARLRFAGHDALVFQVLDQSEIDFDLAEAAPFEGLEGEGSLRIDPRALRSAYLEALSRHQEQLQRTVRAMGFDYQQLSTHEWLGPPLAAFVARRNAFIKQGKRA